MLRKVLFWLHLSVGVGAGLVILLMSVTGVALTYERQLNARAVRHLKSLPPTPGAKRLSPEALLAELAVARPDVRPAGLTIAADADAPVVVLAEPDPVYVDAYTGREIGRRSDGTIRDFLATMRAWHRWLGVDGAWRGSARAITGWSNLLFLFVVVSGAYLWLPRTLGWTQIRQVLWFRRGYGSSKARDFNWHHVIGIWSLVPLFVIVIGALPISFPWANDLVFRAVGDVPPPRPQGPLPARRAPQGTAAVPPARLSTAGLNAAAALAINEMADWRTISLRFPRRAEEPLTFTIDRGDGGQPQLRSTLVIARTGEVVSREPFSTQTRGRQLRSILRFAHTGEVLGIAGQTTAGLASLGAVVMVWTGLALSLRRLIAWRARQRRAGEAAGVSAPVTLAASQQSR